MERWPELVKNIRDHDRATLKGDPLSMFLSSLKPASIATANILQLYVVVFPCPGHLPGILPVRLRGTFRTASAVLRSFIYIFWGERMVTVQNCFVAGPASEMYSPNGTATTARTTGNASAHSPK